MFDIQYMNKQVIFLFKKNIGTYKQIRKPTSLKETHTKSRTTHNKTKPPHRKHTETK